VAAGPWLRRPYAVTGHARRWPRSFPIDPGVPRRYPRPPCYSGETKALASDIKDIYAEAKSAGFDPKVLRQLIRIRKQEAAEVEEQETMLDIYRRALGM
jgi:hypothetical protein